MEVDFGAGPATVPVWTQQVDLSGGKGAIPVPADGPVDWSALDKFPSAMSISWSGPDRGMLAALVARGMPALRWSDLPADVDLSATGLVNLGLHGTDLRRLRLPAGVESLSMDDPHPTLRVESPDDGRGTEVLLRFSEQPPAVPAGLRNARKVWVKVGGEFSARLLSSLAAAESLDVEFLDPPGRLTDTEALRVHHGLTTLTIDNAYDWDPSSLPDLPALRELELNGTLKATAKTLKARFKGTGVTVSVSGAKSDSWVSAHIDNPFLDWVEDSKAFGTAACKAYVKASTAVDGLPADAPDRLERAEAVLRAFVADLNAVEKKYGLIDTLNREHAGDVFDDLAKRAGVPDDTARRWFDENRHF
ncbi:hypothetical protein Ais01nite_09260 [Asanoa ishikariensis]|uniref:Uncharacterized protein n=2 Tax=Asanoa ishikariensis TaxID=137265 RepID=A0A1H3TAC8_9ACTN|nr:hypothetical protein Ais01nite_09260 [Asanoa ishikariensis]SDZ46279.1 hypothetical protein SAMN05421684_5306 [Asanoa ishikariensis]